MSSTFPPHAAHSADRLQAGRYIFAGLCATLVSIGLARFAFTPLLPELIRAHWFSASDAVYLGAANLGGYLLGALVGRPIGARLANERALRLMMVLITAAFVACAFPVSFSWYFGWRFLSGFAGGVVMVLVAATVLPHVPPARKGMAGGAMFLGLGLGIAGSGTLVPLFLTLGLPQTWLGLGGVSALLTAASWFAWPRSKPQSGPAASPHHATRFGWNVRMLYLQYSLMAASAVPPMVFLVDFIARGLGQGIRLGSIFWAIYGVGAIAGPPLYGWLADRSGAGVALRRVCLTLAALLAALAFVQNLFAMAAVVALIGTFAPGMVPLVLARVHEITGSNATRQNIAWTRASIIAAAAMAVAAYGYSALFNAWHGDHRRLFLSAAGVLVLALFAGAFTGSGKEQPGA